MGNPPAKAEFLPDRDAWILQISGHWSIGQSPNRKALLLDLESLETKELRFNFQELKGWDSSLVVTLLDVLEKAQKQKITFDIGELPNELQALLKLARAVPEKSFSSPPRSSFLGGLGTRFLRLWEGLRNLCHFLGESILGLVRFLTGRAQCRAKDFWQLVDDCGPRALPITALISFLTGLILAFVGAVQLRLFGAEIYVADLVALGVVREMIPLMVSMIVAGRSGASFAAHIGTMRVSEETDALTTFGFSPIDVLVVPRLLALILVMPLLCLLCDAFGILGGIVIGVGMLDLPWVQYWTETKTVLTLQEISIGLIKSLVFGAIVALAGCYHGIRCSGSAASVGQAATTAVVSSILWIVIADAIFALLLNTFGI